jgi:hypothetical protein
MDQFTAIRALILTGAISIALPVSGQVTPLASVQNAVGVVVIVRSGGIQERLHGKGNVLLYEGDTVKTESASQGMIEFNDGVQVAVNEHTSFKLLTRWVRGRAPIHILRMKEGEVWVRTGEGRKLLEVETPVATAAVQDAIQDAEFDVRLRPDGQAVLTVISGVADFATSFGTCSVPASTVSSSSRGKSCTSPVQMEVMPTIAWINGILMPAESRS